jgi:hypothetical protein
MLGFDLPVVAMKEIDESRAPKTVRALSSISALPKARPATNPRRLSRSRICVARDLAGC